MKNGKICTQEVELNDEPQVGMGKVGKGNLAADLIAAWLSIFPTIYIQSFPFDLLELG